MSRLHEALQRASDGHAPIIPPEAEQTTGGGQPGFSVPWRLDVPAEAQEERPVVAVQPQAGGDRRSRGPERSAPFATRIGEWFRVHATAAGEKLVVSADADDNPALAVAVEQYRKLAATLYYAQAERGLKVVVVTSAMPGEGKSLTATNLALTLSDSYQHRVLVVDADLRRPSLHSVFGVHAGAGLSEALTGVAVSSSPVLEISPNLTYLPSGHVLADPTSALTSGRLRDLLAKAREDFDWVIIDTPPIGLVSDARLVSEFADGIVVVVEAAKTAYQDIQRAVASLESSKVVGVVLNRVQRVTSGYGSYYGYYHRKAPKAS